ncbi:MAG: SDR family NAD(P)-dependent oxidoreductase [Abditibacteriaceae bacterium]
MRKRNVKSTFTIMPKSVLIIGATSGIASALAHQYARNNHPLLLAARDSRELEIQANDLRVRYNAKVHTLQYDAASDGRVDRDNDQQFWNKCLETCGHETGAPGIYGVILCHGIMPAQEELIANFDLLRQMVEINYLSYISLLEIAAAYFENGSPTAARRGFIAATGSVAGDRGRAANCLYGSTKAGLDIYMQGLRQRLYRQHVSVSTIKPGPIDTAMTFGLERLPLLASPQHAARDIYRGIRRGQDIVYTPFPWRIILPIVKLIPETIWKRMDM